MDATPKTPGPDVVRIELRRRSRQTPREVASEAIALLERTGAERVTIRLGWVLVEVYNTGDLDPGRIGSLIERIEAAIA
jgi:hypothetical protein